MEHIQLWLACQTCKGTGHDKNSHPVVKFEPFEDENGKMKRRHTTLKRGSGCLTCGGIGKVKQ